MTTKTEALSIEDTLKLALDALTATMSTHGFRDSIDESHDKAITAIKEALANHIPDTKKMVAHPEQELPLTQQFCFCNDKVSLQMVSGGATTEGYLGRVTLLIDGQYVDYVRARPEQEPLELEEYDAGMLNDFGGGNVGWWQDYIRAELDRAYEHYQSQVTTKE